ncbi:hypothetical protein B0H11DRAFT_2046500 [Mycena galericulata]|nr:hypothetical protein B0H11DRAFT_2046500 [Mycena galericulata]
MFSDSSSLQRFAVLCLMVAPVLGQFTSQCFTSGVVGNCSAFITDFCSDVANKSVSALNSKSECFNTPGQAFICDLSAVSQKVSSTGTPDEDHCITVLSTVAEECPMGGLGRFNDGGFNFVLDPNSGTCGMPCSD